MSRLKDNFSMHWPKVVGIALFIPAAWKYWTLGQWEAHAPSAAITVLGFVAMIAPDELAS